MDKPKQVFVVHGDDDVCDSFAKKLSGEYGIPAFAPFSGTVYNLAEEKFEVITRGIPIRREDEKDASKRAGGVFARLLAAADRLRRVVMHNEGGANNCLLYTSGSAFRLSVAESNQSCRLQSCIKMKTLL